MKRFGMIFLIGIVILISETNLFAQWEPDVRLTFDNAGSRIYYTNAWHIAAHGDTVHVVWLDKRDGNCEIYYKRSTDGGTTWGIDTRLTYNPETQGAPGIAVSGSYVHVVWDDWRNGSYFEIYYKRSTDGGTTWEIDTKITNGLATEHQPSIAVSGSYVHVVWKDWRNTHAEIYYNHSTDGGTTWGIDTRLTDTFVESWFPSVAVSGSYVHVVWFEDRAINYEIYYKRSTDGGITWETDKRLSDDDPDQSLFPTIAVSGSYVHVVWDDNRLIPYTEIYYKRSTDGGTTWGTDIRLTEAPLLSRHPSVAVSGSNVHLVWQDERDTNYEIYYKRSTDGGITWETTTRLTDDPDNSEWTSIAVSGSKVHVVWEDDRDGNLEIYYKRNPTGNIGIQEDQIIKPNTPMTKVNVFPNPFINTLQINACSKVKIYDISGRFVAEVKDRWDGKNSKGKVVKAGVYFLKVQGYNIEKVVKLR